MLRFVFCFALLPGCVSTLVKVNGPSGEEMYQATCRGGIAECMNDAATACRHRAGYKIVDETSSFGGRRSNSHLVFACNEPGDVPGNVQNKRFTPID